MSAADLSIVPLITMALDSEELICVLSAPGKSITTEEFSLELISVESVLVKLT